MRVNRAKRRLLRWQRYIAKTGSTSTNWRNGGNHAGHVYAFGDVMYAKRCPHPGKHYGARSPWLPSWDFGQKPGT